jgi:hypothetical protein
MREAIANEEPVSVELRNYRKDGTEFWNRVDIAPLHEDGEVTHFVGFQTDVTVRKEAEFEIKRRIEEVETERRNLERLLERIDGLLEDVTRVLVRATTREGIGEAVCDRLTDDDAYDAAWIGERAPAANEVVPEAWAGIEPDGDGGSDDTGADPTVRALETGAAQFASDADDATRRDGADGVGMVGAIPLVSGETTYGVLTVHAAEPDAFDEHERVVLESIGRAIGSAYSALESRRILTADTAVELEFAIAGDDLFFVDLSARADCRFSYEGSARNDAPLLFFTVDGADPGTVRELASESADVADVALLTGDGSTGLFEFRPAGPSLVTTLADRGARVLSMNAESGHGRVRVTVPGGVSPRSVRALFAERCPSAELVASREYKRPPRTDVEYRRSVAENLTDRQLLALQKAYVSGYFDPKRRITGSEIAESMGISRSTFHQHLRAAERKLLGEFFDRDVPD